MLNSGDLFFVRLFSHHVCVQIYYAPEASTDFDHLVAAAAFVDVICCAVDGSDGAAAQSNSVLSLTRALMTPQPASSSGLWSHEFIHSSAVMRSFDPSP